MEIFFSKNKDEFKNTRNRLTEISQKLGISVTDFKKLIVIQKGEKNQELRRNGGSKFEISNLSAKKYTNRGLHF